MKHAIGYVIDLETAATTVDAVILSIGVVEIDMRELRLTGEEIDIPVHPRSQRARHWDPMTIAWWDQQSPEAWLSAFENPHAVPLDTAIFRLGRFLTRDGSRWSDSYSVWGNGPEFDIAILNHAAAQLDQPDAWTYSAARCVRTLLDVAGMPKGPFQPGEIEHHALHDARREARDVVAALKFLQQRIAA